MAATQDPHDPTPEAAAGADRSLTVPEVAERLGVAPVTVYRHLKRGMLPYVKFGGNVRILERDLHAFMEHHRTVGGTRASQQPVWPIPPSSRTLGERAKAWFEIARPFSWTVFSFPAILAGAIAWKDGTFNPVFFVLSVVGVLLLQSGSNVINELFDVKQGVDLPDSPRASKVLVQGRLTTAEAYKGGLLMFGLAALIGFYLVAELGTRSYPVIALGVVGVTLGYFYTAPPIHFKYRGYGTLAALIAMGPLILIGAYYVQTLTITAEGVVAAFALSILAMAILHANEVRDVSDDQRAGFRTLSTILGQRRAAVLYLFMVPAAYLLVIAGVAAGLFSPWALLTLVTLVVAAPAMRTVVRALGVSGDLAPALGMIDIATAKIHFSFSLVFTVTFILERAVG